MPLLKETDEKSVGLGIGGWLYGHPLLNLFIDYSAAIEFAVFFLKPISRMKEAPWIFAHYIKKSTNFAQYL